MNGAADVEVVGLGRQIVYRDLGRIGRVGETAGQYHRAVNGVHQVWVGDPDDVEVAFSAAIGTGGDIQVWCTRIGDDLWEVDDALLRRGQGE